MKNGIVKKLGIIIGMLIMLVIVGCSVTDEDTILLKTVPSPSGKSRIECFEILDGATVSDRMVCYYIPENQTRNLIYVEESYIDTHHIQWLDEETVRINYEKLDVTTDHYESYADDRFGDCCTSSDNNRLMKAMCSGSAEKVEEVLANGKVDLEHMPIKIDTEFGFQDCRALAWIIDSTSFFQTYAGFFERLDDQITDAQREEIARLLIKYGADVNSKGKGGMTYLMGTEIDPEFREMLLDAGIDACAKDIWGDNIIDYDMRSMTDDLMTNDKDDVEEYFAGLEQHGLKPSVDNIRNCYDIPESFNNDFFQYMIKKTDATPKSIGVTKAEYYAMKGDSDALIKYINDGFTKEKESENLLWFVTRNCNVDVMKALKKYGYDFAIKTDNGQTLLHLAAKANTSEVAEYLIDQGISANVKTSWGYSPLTVASIAGNLDVMKVLLDHSAQWRKYEEGYDSDWQCACQDGREKSIDALIALHYQPNDNEIGTGYETANDRTFVALIKNHVPYDIKYESYLSDGGKIWVLEGLQEYQPEKAEYLEKLDRE